MRATLKLYEISADYLEAMEGLADMDDMSTEAIADTLEGIAGAWEDKALNVARYVRTLEAEASVIEDLKWRTEARFKSIAATAARLKAYLKAEMERTGLRPKAADIAIRMQTNPPSVVVDDESLIPDGYFRTEIVRSMRRIEMAAAMKNGEQVPGAHLERTKRVVIS